MTMVMVFRVRGQATVETASAAAEIAVDHPDPMGLALP
jgi:hypothetical protein